MNTKQHEDAINIPSVELDGAEISYFKENQLLLSSTNNSDGDYDVTNDEHSYYPSCSSDNEENCDQEATLKKLLVRWSVKHNVAHSALSDLLKILSKQNPEN